MGGEGISMSAQWIQHVALSHSILFQTRDFKDDSLFFWFGFHQSRFEVSANQPCYKLGLNKLIAIKIVLIVVEETIGKKR